MKIVAVTSCPTGIAHTYMAAEALEQAAKEGGHEIKVETQGAAGAQPLAAEDIAAADVVVFAADVDVRNRERFAGKPLVETSVKRAINHAGSVLAELEAAAARAPAPAAAGPVAETAPAPATKVDQQAHLGTRLRQWLMTGVSYMIPFVAAGGILIALAFLFGGAEVATKVNGGTFQGIKYSGVTDLSKLVAQAGYAGLMFKIGATSFAMLVPILSGFIAYAMADRPGLVPGIVSGLLATAIGAGFLGGLIGGLIAGAVVMAIKQVKVPRAVAGVMPVVVIPLVSTLIVGGLMIVVVGQPIAAAQRGMTNGLNGLASGTLKVMAAVMAAGMTPPIGLALATVVRPKLFTKAERVAGEAAWLLGASFITEGAIPFAAADPIRVIPSLMVGSAVTGALSMAFRATSRAPHGGLWVIGLIGRPLLYVVAIIIGILVTSVCVIAAKSIGRRVPAEAEEEAVVPGAAAVAR